MKSKKIILLVLIGLSLTACSNLALDKAWDERGYSQEDKDLAMNYKKQYMPMLGNTMTSPLAHNENEKRLRAIFCSCVKKLGDKCLKKPTGLTGDDKQLWGKANGAEMALRNWSSINNFGSLDTTSGSIDPAECQ